MSVEIATLHSALTLEHPIAKHRRAIQEQDAVKIVIPDDYQNIADKVACFSLIRHHEVTRYTDAAHNGDILVERLREADVVVAIRERVTFSRALLESLPRLRLIALLGRGARTIDFAACTEHLLPAEPPGSGAAVLNAPKSMRLEAAGGSHAVRLGQLCCRLPHKPCRGPQRSRPIADMTA